MYPMWIDYEEFIPPYPIAHGVVGVWGTPILSSSMFHDVACAPVQNAAIVRQSNARHRDPSDAGFESLIDMDQTMEIMQ